MDFFSWRIKGYLFYKGNFIVSKPFCWKCVRVKSYAYTCTVNKLEYSYQLPALQSMPIDWLIFAGVYLLWRQRKGKQQKYHIQMLVHWFLFCGVSYCDNRERVLCWLWYKRERTSKHSAIWFILGGYAPHTNQIASCFDALSITKFKINDILIYMLKVVSK
jgi:hypothetical protein